MRLGRVVSLKYASFMYVENTRDFHVSKLHLTLRKACTVACIVDVTYDRAQEHGNVHLKVLLLVSVIDVERRGTSKMICGEAWWPIMTQANHCAAESWSKNNGVERR